LRAQTSTSGLSGTVTSWSGAAVSAASVTAKNLNTGQSASTQTDGAGHFSLPQLTTGEHELSVTALGFSNLSIKTMLAEGVGGTIDLALTPVPQSLPNAPSSSKAEPSLSDLGFTPEQMQSNAREQALLDKRTHMLKIHQKLGLITAAPLIATVATSIGAGGKHTSNTDRTVHMVLGSVTSDLYFTSAYFAIRAPRIKGTQTRGPIRVHKALAWIHGPGMILTPILGALAYQQKNNGEKVHGIAAAHGPVAIVTAGAFGAALLSVSMKF
jgi:Carboxypeptidase regulatory-like domain